MDTLFGVQWAGLSLAPAQLGARLLWPNHMLLGFCSDLATLLVSPWDVLPACPLEWAQRITVPASAHCPPNSGLRGRTIVLMQMGAFCKC